MHSEPSKIVVTGIIVSAVAVVAYVSQSDTPWLSTEDFGAARSDEPGHRTLGNMVSGVVTAGPVMTHRNSGNTTASAPQAARQSPQRNEPVAAQTQPNVPNPDVHARADNGQRVTSAAREEKKPQPRSTPLRTSASKVRHSRSHESHLAVRVPPANRATRDAQDQMALDKLVARLNSNSAPGGRASVAGAPAVASQTYSTPAEPKGPLSTIAAPAVVPLSPPILSAPHTESTPPASPPPVVQSIPPEAAPIQSGGGPKTRAQVRSEIGRAREDGSLPAFGNPDPAGPAGAPSLTSTPRP